MFKFKKRQSRFAGLTPVTPFSESSEYASASTWPDIEAYLQKSKTIVIPSGLRNNTDQMGWLTDALARRSSPKQLPSNERF